MEIMAFLSKEPVCQFSALMGVSSFRLWLLDDAELLGFRNGIASPAADTDDDEDDDGDGELPRSRDCSLLECV